MLELLQKALLFYHQELASSGLLSHILECCIVLTRFHLQSEALQWSKLPGMMKPIVENIFPETKQQHKQVKDSTCKSISN